MKIIWYSHKNKVKNTWIYDIRLYKNKNNSYIVFSYDDEKQAREEYNKLIELYQLK
jgi:hypothetical protein